MKAWLNSMVTMISLWCSRVVKEEKGDTNFISILIILAIVILLATLFIAFKNQIVAQVESIVDGFTIG